MFPRATCRINLGHHLRQHLRLFLLPIVRHGIRQLPLERLDLPLGAAQFGRELEFPVARGIECGARGEGFLFEAIVAVFEVFEFEGDGGAVL